MDPLIRKTRTPRRKAGRAGAAAVSASGMLLALSVTGAPAQAASLATWEKMAQCESSGDWGYNQAPYYGGLQFLESTWVAYHGTDYAPYPYQATKEQQIRVAQRVLDNEGAAPWPHCGKEMGLADDDARPFPDAPDDGASARVNGDFDGDGRDDVAVLYDYGKEGGVSRSGLWTFSGSGGGFGSPKKVWDSGSASWSWSAAKLAVGDFNGDGKADIAVLYDMGRTEDGRNRTKLYEFTSNGSGFNSPVKVWDSNDDPVKSWNWASSKLTVGDFNGDGKADIGVLYDYGQTDSGNRTALWNFTSNGSGFNSPKQTWDSNNDPVKSWNWEASKPVSGDFNGDGKTDIGVLYDYGKTSSGNRTGLWTFTSTGSGFNSPKQTWDSGSESWRWSAAKVVGGDFNGDGKADIGVLYDLGRNDDRNRTELFTFAGNGTGLNAPTKVWDSRDDSAVKSWNWATSKPVAGDFNGDGKTDIGVLYDYGQTDSGNRTGLWNFTSNGNGFAGPKLTWDSRTDPVKSWNWNMSKVG